MKKLILAVMLVIGITAFAQQREPRKAGKERLTSEEKVDLQVKRMTKELSLNEKQATEVRSIVTKEVAKRETKKAALKEQKDKKREEVKAEMQKEQAAFSAEMKKVLTPEQYAKWEKNREEKKAKLKDRMSERRGKGDFKPLEEDK